MYHLTSMTIVVRARRRRIPAGNVRHGKRIKKTTKSHTKNNARLQCLLHTIIRQRINLGKFHLVS